ncbi:MAG: antibiotic biosynthesis monooxygenase [Reyranellaceae bacterium]
MSADVVLIVTAKVRVGKDADFVAWKARWDRAAGKFPGFVSSDIMPSGAPAERAWTIIQTFRSRADADGWEQSTERAALLAEGRALFDGGTLAQAKPAEEGGAAQNADVTEVIFSKIRPGMEDAYREWSARIQAAQARHPGYKGMFLQPPDVAGGIWTTIIRFDSAAHLESWMSAPERAELLRESKAFIEHEQLTRLATSFPGWVPIDPATGKGPPDWKTAMLVLLGLFPIVMLEMKFLSPIWASLGLHASLATFFGNAISVALTSFATMPLFVRWFGWWLFVRDDSPRFVGLRGVMLLVVLFAAEVLALWKLLPW